MKKGWTKYKFREIVDFQPSIKLQKGEEYWFIPMEDIQEKTSYVFPKQKKVFDGSSGAKFSDGDIIFSRITPCLQNGKISQARLGSGKSGFGSTEYFIFRGKKNIVDQKFLFYLVTSKAFTGSAINSMVGASGRQRADKGYLNNLDLIIPPHDEQIQIGKVLSKYDDLIVNNNEQISILERTAGQLYKEWFVRLRFPGHEDTPIVRGIPEGWELKKLENVISAKNGKAIASKELDDYGLFPVYGSNGVIGYANKSNAEDSIVVGRVGAYCGSIEYYDKKLWSTDNTIVCKSDSKRFPNIMAAYYLKALKLRNYATGSAQPMLTQNLILKREVVIPTEEVAVSFLKHINPLLERINTLTSQNDILNRQRDILLPRLISGQLSVMRNLKN